MKAAVLGVNGYLGKHIAHFLLQKGWKVAGYGRQTVPSLMLTDYTQLDVAKRDDYILFDSSVDFIFYCAGVTGTAKGFQDYEKYLDVNEKGLLNLLDTLRKDNSKARIIFPSTRLVYKGFENIPLNEDSEKEFKTIYALNKWFGEKVLDQYGRYFNIQYTIFRICVPYGNLFDGSYSYGTMGILLRKAMEGNNITLFGNGSQKRTFIHIEDVCNQMFNTIQFKDSINTVFNLGGENFSLKDIADKIAYHFGVSVVFSNWTDIDFKLESGDTIFDATKIQQLNNTPIKNNFTQWLKEIK